MRILSLYAARKYLTGLFLALAAFVAVFLAVDLTDRMNEFLDRAFEGRAILTYYFYYVPYVVVLSLPMASLLSCLLSVGDLSRRLELTAMAAAGLNLSQILGPVALTALGVSLFALVLADGVVPEANRRRAEVGRGGALETTAFAVREDVLLRDGSDQLLSIGRYEVGTRVGDTVVLDTFAPSGGSGDPETRPRLRARTTARRIRWAGERWVLENGAVRVFEDGGERMTAFETRIADHLSLRPEDVERRDRKPEEMGYADLRRDVARKHLVGAPVKRELTELQLKIAFPFGSLAMVLFGAPLAASLRRTGRGAIFGLCLLLAFFYYGSAKGCQALGWNGILPPVAAAWLPNGVFGLIGTALFLRPRR